MSEESQVNCYTGPRPGDRITTIEQVETLPIGSVVTNARDTANRFQKGDSFGDYSADYGWYNTYNGNSFSAAAVAQQFGDGWFEVESVPVDMGETVAQFAWRFRDIAIIGSERALGGADAAVRVLDDMKVPFRASVGLRITNQFDRNQLPNGTIVYSGDPDDYDSFTVVKKEGRRWVTLLGKGRPIEERLAVTIDQLPLVGGETLTRPEDWLVKEAKPADRTKVLDFQLKAWAAAAEEKRRRSWCSELERVVIRAGLTENLPLLRYLNGHRIGDEVTPEQAAALSEGVILSTPDDRDDGAIGVFQRVAKAKNRAGTKQVFGFNFPGHYAQRMVIRAVPENGTAGLGIRCLSTPLMDAAPDGSVIGSAPDNLFMRVGTHTDRPWQQVYGYSTSNERVSVGSYQPEAFSPGSRSPFWFYRFGPREEIKG